MCVAARAGTTVTADGKVTGPKLDLMAFLPPTLRAKLKEKRKPEFRKFVK